MTAFAELMEFQRETEALAQIAGRLEWDQETMMPPGAAEQRGEERAALESVLHARRTDPRVGEWLSAAEAPDPAGARSGRPPLTARPHVPKTPHVAGRDR